MKRSSPFLHPKALSFFLLIAAGWLVLDILPNGSRGLADSLENAVAIRELITDREDSEGFSCAGERICGVRLIPGVYLKRAFKPLWISGGTLSAGALELVDRIRRAGEDGLRPSDYHLHKIERIMRQYAGTQHTPQPHDPRIQAELDILLTDAFFLLSSHLYGGRVNPETIHSQWEAFGTHGDLSPVLDEALQGTGISRVIATLHPPHAGYRGMRRALSRYRDIAACGGWQAVPEGATLRPGDESGAVALLRERLKRTGDLQEVPPENPSLFDGPLEQALQRFQQRHGLAVDGVAGKNTFRALNMPVEERVRQIEINMERWRWVPHDLGERYLIVNIADYRLWVMEKDEAVFESRVIVGRTYRKTPVFNSRMTYLVFNPFWNVPHRLAVRDILPKIKKDPDYLQREGFRVFSGWEEDAPEIDPGTVDWQALSVKDFPYRLKQDPGPQNPLGRVKFMFPNKYSVYLHDTPSRRLFLKPVRGYSSGCIRVEEPVGLAEYVLAGQEGWTSEAIGRAIEGGGNRVVGIERPINVHLLYWTAWVDEGEIVHFRDDIYDRDLPLARALEERPPKS